MFKWLYTTTLEFTLDTSSKFTLGVLSIFLLCLILGDFVSILFSSLDFFKSFVFLPEFIFLLFFEDFKRFSYSSVLDLLFLFKDFDIGDLKSLVTFFDKSFLFCFDLIVFF